MKRFWRPLNHLSGDSYRKWLSNKYPWTRLSVRIIGVIKRQFFHMVTHVFDNRNLSQKLVFNRRLGSCSIPFGTWSQAHAYDPSDNMETRFYCIYIEFSSSTFCFFWHLYLVLLSVFGENIILVIFLWKHRNLTKNFADISISKRSKIFDNFSGFCSPEFDSFLRGLAIFRLS